MGQIVANFRWKKSLMRLCRHFSEGLQISSIRSWEEMRGCLANVIASKGAIDDELKDYINSLDKV